MAFTFTLGSLDCTASGLNVVSYDPGYPDLTDSGKSKALAGLPLIDADYGNREFVATIYIKGSSKANRDSLYRSLVEEVMPTSGSSTNSLTFNSGGGTSVTFTFYRGASTAKVNHTPETDNSFVYEVELVLICQPFAKGAQVDLPKNYVIDSGMFEDFSGDGVCNSFTDVASGNVTDTRSIDSGQKIDVTACAADATSVGVSQTMADIDAAETWSYRIEYKCAAATSCKYDIYILYNDGGATKHWLLNGRTAVNGTWTEVVLENQTVPAGATQGILYCVVTTTAASGSVGTLWVRRAMAVQAAALTNGLDSNNIYYGSLAGETPSTFEVMNIPGDAPALAQMQFGNSTGTAYTFVGMTEGVGPYKFIYKGTGTGDAAALGDVCNRNDLSSDVSFTHTIGLPATYAEGTYLACVKSKTSAATPTGDYLDITILDADTAYGISWGGTAYFADANYDIMPIAAVSLPVRKYPDIATSTSTYNVNVTYYGSPGSGNWDVDYVLYMPTQHGSNSVVFDWAGGRALCTDTINNEIGSYTSAAVSWPINTAAWKFSTNPMSGSPFTLPFGNSTFVMLAASAINNGTIYDGQVSISFVPRYLLVQ